MTVAPVFTLPTSGPRTYRGKYPARARSVSYSRDSGLHVELNNGTRLWTLRPSDHYAGLPSVGLNMAALLERAVPMTAEQYETLRSAAVLLRTRAEIAGHGRRAELETRVRAMLESIIPADPETKPAAPARVSVSDADSYGEPCYRVALEDAEGNPVTLVQYAPDYATAEETARKFAAQHGVDVYDSTKAGREALERSKEAPAPIRRDNVEYYEGRKAYQAGALPAAMPYSEGGERAARWNLGYAEAKADAEALGKAAPVPAGVIDMTPTWAGMLPTLRMLVENGSAEGRRIAWEELGKAAALADDRNRLVSAISAALDSDKGTYGRLAAIRAIVESGETISKESGK